jgi:hypothetical protein
MPMPVEDLQPLPTQMCEMELFPTIFNVVITKKIQKSKEK